jgi:hypothetical protein
VTIRGSGGQRALGLSTSASDTSGGNHAASLLAQLFRPASTDTQKTSNPQKVPEDRYVAMEQKLDKIEKMLDRLLSGGLRVDNDDR